MLHTYNGVKYTAVKKEWERSLWIDMEWFLEYTVKRKKPDAKEYL